MRHAFVVSLQKKQEEELRAATEKAQEAEARAVEAEAKFKEAKVGPSLN